MGHFGHSARGAAAATPVRKRLTLALLAALAGTLALPAATTAAPATAEAQRFSFNIAAKPRLAALADFTAITGIQVLHASAAQLAGDAPALVGGFSAEQALQQLLAGSGFGFRFTGSGAVALEPVAANAGDAVQLGPLRVTGSQRSAAVTEGTGSYTATAAATAARLPLSLRETPQSVSVITRQQIEDRNFVTLDDAMEVATGITASTANFNRISYTARGFSLTDNMIDGMPAVGNAYAGYVPNLAFFDRVEVLRGASGLTYGAGSPGGAVNLVRKRPTAEPQVSVTLRAGRWQNFYTDIDAAGALSEGGGVRGRLVVSYEDRETFIDGEYNRRPAFYGIVEGDLGAATTLHLGGSIERYDANFVPYGLPRFSNGGDLGLPRSSRGLSPRWGSYHTDVDTVFGGIDHRFNDDWSLRVVASQQERVQSGLVLNATGAVNPVTLLGPSYGSTLSEADAPADYASVDAMLTGNFEAFGRRHELVAGGTWSEVDNQPSRSRSGAAPALTQSIFNFDPWSIPQPTLGAWVKSATSSVTTNSGFYAVSRLSLADSLKLIVGGRLSTAEAESRNRATGVKTSTRESDVFSPYGGLLYDFAEHWTAYLSYADIFRVQNTQYDAGGSPLEPVVGANYEAGVKGEFHDGRLNVAFALFRIDEENRAQLDPDNLTPCAGSPTLGDCYIAEGKVRGEGFETELSGEILPGWEMVAGYTFVETEYLRDRDRTGGASSNEGKPFRSTTPKHLFKLWSTYQLPGGLERWSIGGGVNTQSGIYAQSGAVRFEQGGYSIWSARLGYRFSDHWNLSLNVNNLFDKEYYLRLGSLTSGNRYGEPRNWMVTLRGQF